MNQSTSRQSPGRKSHQSLKEVGSPSTSLSDTQKQTATLYQQLLDKGGVTEQVIYPQTTTHTCGEVGQTSSILAQSLSNWTPLG